MFWDGCPVIDSNCRPNGGRIQRRHVEQLSFAFDADIAQHLNQLPASLVGANLMCFRCGVYQPLAAFTHGGNPDGDKPLCGGCARRRLLSWRLACPAARKEAVEPAEAPDGA